MNFKEDLLWQGLEIPYCIDTKCINEQLELYGKRISNRIGHCRTGCIVRDKDEFYPVYRKNVLKK